MDTSTEKLFNDGLYGCETLNADECALISTYLGLEGEDAVEPNWRPLVNGVPMTLKSCGFFCEVTGSWKSRANLQWVNKDTPYTFV